MLVVSRLRGAPYGVIAVSFVLLVGAAACHDSPTSPGGPLGNLTACSPSGTIKLASATSARVDCSNGGTGVVLEGGGASYLVVPQFATSLVPMTLTPYELRATGGISADFIPTTTGRFSVTPSMSPSMMPSSPFDVGLRTPGRSPAQLAFERTLRGRARASFAAGAWREPPALRTLLRASVAPPPIGSVRQFRVLADSTGNSFVTVSASLAYAGANILIYIDTLAPANGFTPSQLQAFGTLFDQTLYPIDTAAFGPPSDVDQNGRVIMLMTPRVNALSPARECATAGFIGGFFEEEDLGSTASDPNSNQGEIFYTLVPDPSGTVSCAHSVSDVGYSVPATFLHELQHLISFSQHVVVHHGQPEAGWLDEGMSIVAEELGSVYYEQKCPPPSCRTDPSQIFPDSSQGFVSSFLYDSYQYALLPDTASVTLHTDSDNGFAWRGGDWLLARWLGDQFGSAVYRRMDENTATGVANIAASTGQPFPVLFGNFGLSLYTDSLPGFPRTTAPADNRFVSRNVRQLWARLFVTSGGASDVPLAFPLPVRTVATDSTVFRMYPGTSSYYRLNTSSSASTVTLQFSAPGGGPLSAGLVPQVAIFRLPPGA